MTIRGFQKQTTTIILDCFDGLDSETFHNIDRNCCYCQHSTLLQKCALNYRKMSLKGYTFCNENI